ncbi:hypothetical protein C2W64_03985 [Brevibacillus laterosporus]|nr:hypothetical protein C2W64_03985 [Brevibacillus laterosporus]
MYVFLFWCKGYYHLKGRYRDNSIHLNHEEVKEVKEVASSIIEFMEENVRDME